MNEQDYLNALMNIPKEEVLGVLIDDLRRQFSVIQSEANYLDVSLEAEEIGLDDVRDVLKMILKVSETVETMMEAAAKYDRSTDC